MARHGAAKQPAVSQPAWLVRLRSSKPRRVALGALAVALFMVAVLASPLLRITSVVAVGTAHTSAATIVRAANVGTGSSMVLLDTGAIAHRVEMLPWVASASIRRRWPSTLQIDVQERTPVATATNASGQIVAVDRSGRVLGVMTSRLGLPGLSIQGHAGQPGSLLTSTAQPCLDVAASVPKALAFQLRAIVCIGSHLQLVFPGPVAFELSLANDLQAKYIAVASMIAKETFHSYDTVDVSDPANVTITPQPHG